MTKIYTSYPKIIDLENCADEPIHLIPNMQNHGFVLVVCEETIIQCSSNTTLFINKTPEEILNTTLEDLFDDSAVLLYRRWQEKKIDHLPFDIELNGSSFHCIPHTSESYTFLDIEPITSDWDSHFFQQRMLALFRELSSTETLQQLTDRAAYLIKDLLEYDRVMIYKFDKQWNGSIISEEKESHLESWKGLHYPASDIPEMARKLFLKQGVRILSDISETYSHLIPGINPITGALTHVGKSHLRGSSPLHIEYLTNMKVSATLNAAIIIDGKLWGLISCHHYSYKYIDFQKRQSTLLLAEMLSNQLAQRQTQAYLSNLKKASVVRSLLLKNLENDWDIINGLTVHADKAIDLIESSGFSILHDGEVVSVGSTPTKAEVLKLVEKLHNCGNMKEDYYVTDCLKDAVDWSTESSRKVSGLILCKLSHKKNDALIWYRPEVLTSVTWGGNPNYKNDKKEKEARLSPRKSFEKWTESVQCTSEPWNDFEIAAARQLTQDIQNVIVSKFGEISQLNKKLINLNQELESFSYSVSHDLRGPLRGIDGFAQILLEDYADILDDEGVSSLKVIINSAEKMNTLMDEILSYSGLNQLKTHPQMIDVAALCKEIITTNNLSREYPNTTFSISEPIASLYADRSMAYQLFMNLITNAYKYSSIVDSPKVTVRSYISGNNNIFEIKDNGIGFDAKYSDKVFRIFTRLVKDEFKGTGVGLAIAQRIVMKHNGEIWCESSKGNGAIFSFYFKEKHTI